MPSVLSDSVDSLLLAEAVRLYVRRAIEGHPVPARTVAMAQFSSLADADWADALETLHGVLLKLDGRTARKWGLTRKQGSRFSQWRRGRVEHASC